MKKIILLLSCVVCFGILSSTAQEGQILAGVGLSYSTDIDNVGIFANGVYRFTDTWEASARYTYYFEKDMINWSFLDFDGHYVFAESGTAKFYGLAGLNILFWKVDAEIAGISVDENDTDLGFNIGAGTRLPISDMFDFMGEVKYTIGNYDFFTASAGILYKF